MTKAQGDGETLSTVYPSSLQYYVEDILRSSELSSELSDHYKKMNNESARYISFRTFPLFSSLQPIKLAKAGFFYTGQGDETSCFSCGLRNKNWKSDESPLDLHKRLSPYCIFINGNGVCNAPKNGYANGACMSYSDSDTTTTNSQSLENGKRSEKQFRPSFTKVISEVRNSDNAQGQISPTNTTDRLVVERNISLAERQINSPDGIQSREPEYSSTITPTVKTGEADQTFIIDPTKEKAMKQNIHHFEINFEKSKYPHYSDLTLRLESFRGWLSHHTQTPAGLAAAGFYYVGVGDCVRCFFCGGGFRSWEQGDDPWIEHAQWYPDCDFLKQKKGDDFVLRQQAGINLRSEELFNIEPHLLETSEVRFGDQVFNIISKTSVVEADSKDIMDLTAVQSVLFMGYSLEMVRQAIQILQSRKGKSVISGNSLMEVIFEIEEAESIKQTIELDISNMKQSLDKMMRADDIIKAGNETNGNCVTLQNSISSIDEEKNNEYSKGSMSPEKLRSLLEQNRELKDKMTCKICMDREACIVFLPCCHMMACPQCAPALRNCPVCRQVVNGTVRAYVS